MLPHRTISPARPAAINDRLLAQLRRVAHDAPLGMASEAECEWLLSAVGPLLDELAARRVWMAGHAQGADLSNVVTLAPIRA
jgi:hypothetical protein